MSEKPLTLVESVERIDSIVAEAGVLALADKPALLQTVTLAKGMMELRKVLSDGIVEKYFMPLQGSPLGFMTDRQNSQNGPKEYPVDVVRDVVIEALLRQFRTVGNEFNIISGRFYAAKNGLERLVMTHPGLTDFSFDLSVPVMVADKGALVEYRASWLLHGEVFEIAGLAPEKGRMDTRIPVRVNAGMGPDAILGKATRKLFARVHKRVAGPTALGLDPDADAPVDVIDTKGHVSSVVQAAPEGRRMSLRRPREEPGDREPGQEG